MCRSLLLMLSLVFSFVLPAFSGEPQPLSKDTKSSACKWKLLSPYKANSEDLMLKEAEERSEDLKDEAYWIGPLRIEKGRRHCTYENSGGTIGSRAYYSSESGRLLFISLISLSEGMMLEVIDAATCRIKWHGSTPYTTLLNGDGSVCEWSDAFQGGSLVFKPEVLFDSQGQASQSVTNCREAWILDFFSTCQPRWRKGFKPVMTED